VPRPIRTSDAGRFRVEWFAELGSTNEYILDTVRSGRAADGLVVVADHQTAGRGRLGRTWEAPPGSSLLVSVLLHVDHRDPAHRVVAAASLALAGAVETVAGTTPRLKWPNDLVVGDRKLAGLLAEREGDALVVGAGCNVNWRAFPPHLADLATACNLEAGHTVDRDALLDAFLARLADELDDLDGVIVRARERSATLGRCVRVERLGAAPLVGVAVALDEGALIVRSDDGGEHRITTADVFHVRSG
jgi:BirA family biotin operon repressor/biotin-[acetyl-CoA-carboxylase] ligase